MPAPTPPLRTLLLEWGRIGCLGFGGPPTHIRMLRESVVERREWIDAGEFEDAIATCNLLPGPSSTQLAIWSAWRLRGPAGAWTGGLAFIVPGLLAILALSALFLGDPPSWVLGAGAGAGAAVPAVAVHAGWGLTPASWRRVGPVRARRLRWLGYALAGAVAAATIGPWLVLVLLACGLVEICLRHRSATLPGPSGSPSKPSSGPPAAALTVPVLLAGAGVGGGTLLALCWTALKAGALSYGGGFVIVPLMQGDAVDHHGWMAGGEFLNAVALGQVTPGPVTHTVGVVGWAAAGPLGALLATAVAFAPSYVFVLLGGRHFDRLRTEPRVRSFLDGAGPAAVGAIYGSAVPLGRELAEPWQLAVTAAALLVLLGLRRGVVPTLVGAAAVGVVVFLA